MAIKIHKKLAKSISYDASKKRSLNSIKYIVIHYTGNKGDTAKEMLHILLHQTQDKQVLIFL